MRATKTSRFNPLLRWMHLERFENLQAPHRGATCGAFDSNKSIFSVENICQSQNTDQELTQFPVEPQLPESVTVYIRQYPDSRKPAYSLYFVLLQLTPSIIHYLGIVPEKLQWVLPHCAW